MQPKIVKEIREPAMNGEELGPIYKSFSPNVLNDIGGKDQWLERVHIGFKKVMQEPGGTAYRYFSTATYSPAGKTGTAEAFYDGQYRVKGDAQIDTMNLSLVGYAPSDNPEIAMAVIVPGLTRAVLTTVLTKRLAVLLWMHTST
ncbi:cell division protein FtsI [Mesobacillus boroniphilus JCM 21738]|uniref:Cell division protein FtsI n=1 Tax=Mesobacillus boroniphilus JCM 21738 TaxID=1294265 RepID=W4RKW5_9BACI|nr:cell division protein FtsI [Mesobacillus boroniphilus JCM 21738]